MEQRVIEIVKSSLPRDGISVSLDSDIQLDLNFDSLDIIMLWNELEEEFSIEIRDEYLRGVRTVGDIINSIEKMQGMVQQL